MIAQIVDRIMDYEIGGLSDDATIDLFADLVKSGMAWSLQGHYGRIATFLIKEGYISKDGKVLKHKDGDE
jgi:hypothetical protein